MTVGLKKIIIYRFIENVNFYYHMTVYSIMSQILYLLKQCGINYYLLINIL